MLFLLGFPLTDSKSTSLPPTGRRSAALRRGLFSCHILKIGLHPCGAVFLHLLGDTTVYIKGKCCCSVSQIVLHRLYIQALFYTQEYLW